MKYLGIDFGSKRVGVAVSDENGKMAFPHSVILNDKKLLEKIGEIIRKENIDKTVIGESKNFAGEPNVIMAEINKFKKELEEKMKMEVIFEPEFMTSAQAKQIQHRRRGPMSRPERREPKNEMLDASAATIILQSYLDKNFNMI